MKEKKRNNLKKKRKEERRKKSKKKKGSKNNKNELLDFKNKDKNILIGILIMQKYSWLIFLSNTANH
jgi:hypothetical protein